MTVLTTDELVGIYEGVIKPFGHPDPLGYMTRALLISGGDPEYIDVEGRTGFMPVDPGLALDKVGATEVQSLQSNLVATLSMDRINFNQYRTIDNMIIAFHYGEDAVLLDKTSEQNNFINEINDSRTDTHQLMYPRLATVNDVINLLDPSQVDVRLSTKEKDFFKFLLRGE